MPKKFAGENSKAVAARQRKENAKQEKDQKVKKMLEDAEWEDNDEKLKKKQQKKEEQEKKRQEQLQKKAEAKALLEKEMESLKGTTKNAPPPPKITRAQISLLKEKTVKAEPPKPVPSRVVIDETPLEENLNRIQLDGELAQTVDEAISILSDKSEVDRHPEKRLKAAYTAFEESNLPRLKAENPNLRLSQLKQMLKKEWLKSPQNPINQKI
ncbi:coiled-coil domain-containing protein 124 isoform X1 [Galleria mellonella]|uniref:Coiled-coil domain-containing protein 124 n=1 Tax=Galleria mellonella TaxID=7137 RepID=A0A6J1X0F4_GALME|nr:coiled-coil domain-containing protein 124 isoform X1 [Galleria mellonella]XP_026758896.1 coiled-coil domain-containing protein 124 isoform X1 [Galleria mellonella]XP_052748792.1 coiled-coil domain-containing protein 124 isoform X1 [Galleria mellonella]